MKKYISPKIKVKTLCSDFMILAGSDPNGISSLTQPSSSEETISPEESETEILSKPNSSWVFDD